jgi:hypothetical protein
LQSIGEASYGDVIGAALKDAAGRDACCQEVLMGNSGIMPLTEIDAAGC